MNYNDQILENKTFNLFKQLMYNIALAICIMLCLTLVFVYGFGFRLYEVLTASEAPHLPVGCMVVVKAQKEYKVGDIIKFDTSSNKTLPTTHRLIAIVEEGGTTYYICHGDNVQNVNGLPQTASDWEDDAKFVNELLEGGMTVAQMKQHPDYGALLQMPTINQIEGKVINHINNYGTYFNFIKEHYMLLVALIAGIWCFSSVIQNEIDMKKCRRLY